VPDGADHRLALKLLAWIIAVWLAGMALLVEAAALTPEASGILIAVFPIGTDTTRSISASAAADAKLVSTSWFENVVVVADEAPGLAGRLKDQGALAVFKNMSFAGFSFAGCIGASTPGN
jgi:hypothetical protein